MKLIKVKNYKELSKITCGILVREIKKNPCPVIGFATGRTPLGFYKELAQAYRKKQVDFSKITAFNLDEYYPISKKNKSSYFYYMYKNFFDRVNINKKNINFLNGEAKNPARECLDYEKKIKQNPIDIQILGVGVNGHIGFNEPGSRPESKTRVVELSEETLKRNSKYFKGKNKIPKRAFTMGVKTIMDSKKIILLASGKEKRNAIRHLINGKTSSEWPVSFLKKHKNLIVIADKNTMG